METDWGVAAAAEDPLIDLPWLDSATGIRFQDLRFGKEEQLARIKALSEVAGAPALATALLQLNDVNGVLATSKCDRWTMDETELAELALVLDATVEQHGCASYIDVLLTHPLPMADFLLHEEWARTTAIRCAALAHPAARLDLVIRPARMHGAWGYGLSMYIYAAASEQQQAATAWADALEDCIPILRAAAEGTMAAPEAVSPR